MSVSHNHRSPPRSQRPKATTVFAAAFLAGAAAAVGLNRTLDVHLAQRQPRVESEPIFVALRSLPSGAPVTVWDVALREWPKAMLPAAAMRPRDTFAGMVLKHPLREGQPILSVQLVKAVAPESEQVAQADVAPAQPVEPAAPQTDLWAPAEVPAAAAPPMEAVSEVRPPVAAPETVSARASVDVEPVDVEPVDVEPVDIEPVVSEPVVVAAPAATDIDRLVAPVANAEESTPAQAREPAMRYLVVPERIALEADRSFVPSPDQAASEAVPETTAAAAPQRPSVAPVQTGRAPRAMERTSSSRDRQPQRPPRSAASQAAPAKQPERTSFLRSMIPSMSLGMGAVEPALRTDAAPERASEPAQRPAFRGFGLFR
jgi:hypothetical protein